MEVIGLSRKSGICLDEALEAALIVNGETTLEKALMTDTRVSIEIPAGTIKDLLPPPSTQTELMQSPFLGAFQHSQCVEINDLLGAGCFVPVDKDYTPGVWIVVA